MKSSISHNSNYVKFLAYRSKERVKMKNYCISFFVCLICLIIMSIAVYGFKIDVHFPSFVLGIIISLSGKLVSIICR